MTNLLKSAIHCQTLHLKYLVLTEVLRFGYNRQLARIENRNKFDMHCINHRSLIKFHGDAEIRR